MGEKWGRFKAWIRGVAAWSASGSVLERTNNNLLVWTFVSVAVLWAVSLKQNQGSRVWNQFIVAMGAEAAGCLLGFAYASFGKEREDLKPMFAAVNGLLGGAAVLDLSKGPNSLIRAFVGSLAGGCGYSDGGAIIAMIVVTFGTLGFLTLYYNRKLSLNLELATADEQLEVFAKGEASTSLLKDFWKPGGQVNPGNEEKLRQWMAGAGLDKITLTVFLHGREFAEQRKRAVQDLKLS